MNEIKESLKECNSNYVAATPNESRESQLLSKFEYIEGKFDNIGREIEVLELNERNFMKETNDKIEWLAKTLDKMQKKIESSDKAN